MKRLIVTLVSMCMVAAGSASIAQVQEKVIFRGSDRNDYYDPSWGFVVSPSSLELLNEKLPVDTRRTYAGTNGLRLHWFSRAGGDWGVAIASAGWLPFDMLLEDSLLLKVYSETAIKASDLPVIYLEDIRNWKTGKLKLAELVSDLPAGQWISVKIPSQALQRHSQGADLSRIKSVFIGQDTADGVEHTVCLDDLNTCGGAWLAHHRFIVVLGSSTAVGTGADNIDSTWVNRLRNYVEQMDSTYQVVNLAVAGYSTYRVMPEGVQLRSQRAASDLGKNISTAMEYLPRAIVINVSSEDVAYGYSIAEQIANYDTLFAFTGRHGVPLWITTPQPRNFPSLGMRQQLVAARDSFLRHYSGGGSRVIDFWTDIADSSGGIRSEYDSGDGINLNNAGHGILFRRVEAAGVYRVLAR